MTKATNVESNLDSADPTSVRVCAVVVALNPDPAIVNRLQAVRKQVDQIVLVDNGSGEETQRLLGEISKHGLLNLIRNDANAGVATALNQGLRVAADLGYSWVLTLDQDSEPHPDMVCEQRRVVQELASSNHIAVIGAQVVDVQVGRSAPFLRPGFGPFFRRSPCRSARMMDVTTVITSGALIWLPAFQALGGFREDLYVDYVDTEFCLHAKSNGYRILAACRAMLGHRLGNRKAVALGPFALFPTFHSPGRWYTISRNRIPMLRAYAVRFPHWLAYEIVASVFTTFRMLLTEDQKLAKAGAIARGTWDGLTGRLGPPPARYRTPSS